MKYSGNRVLLCLMLLLFPVLSFAGTAIVDCSGATPGAFTSLGQAIASLPTTGPNTVLISGSCTENVFITRQRDLTIVGNPTATLQPADSTIEVLLISSSQNLAVRNIVVTGGQGVSVSISNAVRFDGDTVQNSGLFGLTTSDSIVHIQASTITANTRSGLVINGGSVTLEGGNNISNNGRLGISAGSAHLRINDGFGPNIISHNPASGMQIFGTGQADISGNNQITSNGGPYGLLVINTSGLSMTDGTISGNAGVGVHCAGTTHCEFGGATQITGNGAGGVEIVEHSEAALDGGLTITANTGVGLLIDQNSSLTSLGGNTITNNTGDAVILNALSALKFEANDTITATAGNLALNCNNGSLVTGDISTYKPKRCGAAFQAVPIH